MTIAFVNGTAMSIASSTPLSGPFDFAAQNHTTGNAIIVIASNFGSPSGIEITGVTDTASNTYVAAGTTAGTVEGQRHACWIAKNATGNASNVVRITFAADVTYSQAAVLQYSKSTTYLEFDALSTPALDGYVTTHTSGSITTATDNELLLGAFSSDGVGDTFSSSAPSTLRANYSTSYGVAERIVGTAGAYTVSIDTATGEPYHHKAWAFKEAAGSSNAPRALHQFRQRR